MQNITFLDAHIDFALQLLPLFPCNFENNLSLAVVMILLLQLASLLFVLNFAHRFFSLATHCI